jgi:hypothetical protein
MPQGVKVYCALTFTKSFSALQVEPKRFKDQDQATIDDADALQVQKERDQFFTRLDHLVNALQYKRLGFGPR